MVLGSYHNSSNFNKSIIEVRSDGGVNLYGLLEFVFKDMMLFAELKDNMLLNDFPKPFLTYVDFLRLFEIEDWVYENNFDISLDIGQLVFINPDTGEKLHVIDATFGNYNPPEIIDKFVDFVRNHCLEHKET